MAAHLIKEPVSAGTTRHLKRDSVSGHLGIQWTAFAGNIDYYNYSLYEEYAGTTNVTYVSYVEDGIDNRTGNFTEQTASNSARTYVYGRVGKPNTFPPPTYIADNVHVDINLRYPIWLTTKPSLTVRKIGFEVTGNEVILGFFSTKPSVAEIEALTDTYAIGTHRINDSTIIDTINNSSSSFYIAFRIALPSSIPDNTTQYSGYKYGVYTSDLVGNVSDFKYY